MLVPTFFPIGGGRRGLSRVAEEANEERIDPADQRYEALFAHSTSVGSIFFAPSERIRVFISYERGGRMQTFRRVAMTVEEVK